MPKDVVLKFLLVMLFISVLERVEVTRSLRKGAGPAGDTWSMPRLVLSSSVHAEIRPHSALVRPSPTLLDHIEP